MKVGKRLFSKRSVLQTSLGKTVYKRHLSDQLIAFSSPQGREIFKQAIQDDYMANYFPLSEQFTTQQEPAYCGPASLIMVLNAMQKDPMKPWKGIWRWYDELMLNFCCIAKEDMEAGLSLEQMTILARCNNLHSQTFRATETSVPEALIRGKKAIKFESQNDENCEGAVCISPEESPLVSEFDQNVFRTAL